MKRTPTSTAISPVFIIGIVVIVLIGGFSTSGVGNLWLRMGLMVIIALVLTWPLKKIMEATEKRSEEDRIHDENH